MFCHINSILLELVQRPTLSGLKYLILWPNVNSQKSDILVGAVSFNGSDEIWTYHAPVHFHTLPNWRSLHPVIIPVLKITSIP